VIENKKRLKNKTKQKGLKKNKTKQKGMKAKKRILLGRCC
jgi:hypothetical protein